MQIKNIFDMPRFGFGLMRLPIVDSAPEKIDLAQVCQMVDAALEKGFIYFDTAYPYHNGYSERAVKEVLVNRHPREDFLLADKLPSWALKTRDDVPRVFSEQLSRTGAGYFDFYLFHALKGSTYPTYTDLGCWEWAMEMKKAGNIRHFGFSYHDCPEVLDRVLTDHPEVEFVQLQLNYLDWENPVVQSRANYEVCKRHGIPVFVMEPVKGGTLANLPPECAELLSRLSPEKSQASWALRYVAGLDGVAMILSGMSNERQVADNVSTMSGFVPLNQEEYAVLGKIVSIINSKPTIGCTECRYCVEGCPEHILIPDLFRAMNSATVYGLDDRAKDWYAKSTAGIHSPAKDCIKCGKCEKSCPQSLPIRELLTTVSETFDK